VIDRDDVQSGARLRWQVAQVIGIREETRTARTVALDVQAWVGHLPGQHIDVKLTADDGYSAQRSYSLSAPCDGNKLELTVQRIVGGEVSTYLTDELRVGDQVEIRGPIGGWFAWRSTSAEPLLLVAGGSGIAPLMAMIRERSPVPGSAQFRLVYSSRTPDDVYYSEELARLTRECGWHRVDGNAAAGAFGEALGLDVTIVTVTCAGCGQAGKFAECHVYASAPGIVVRCPGVRGSYGTSRSDVGSCVDRLPGIPFLADPLHSKLMVSLVELAQRVRTADVVDAMGRLHRHRCHLLDLVSPTPNRQLFGPAVTISYFPTCAQELPPERYNFKSLFYDAIRDGAAGHVLVLASNSYVNESLGGGTKMVRLATHKLAGLLTDGKLRDFDELRSHDFTIYCRGETAMWGGDVVTPFEANRPAVLAGVDIRPGDYVFADKSGAAIIPVSQTQTVLEEAVRIAAEDAGFVRTILHEDPGGGGRWNER
jgi:4-hydroxy-4-methyl-2-oxoglutarate aldolase